MQPTNDPETPVTTCVVSLDDFGDAVATAVVRRLDGAADIITAPVSAARLPVADCYVLASGRPAPVELGVLDDAVHAWRSRLIPVCIEHPFLRLGPVVVPKASPCHHCYFARAAQHAPVPEYARAVLDHFRRPGVVSLPGYPPPIVDMAAAYICGVIGRPGPHSGTAAGHVELLHLLDLQVFRGAVVGVHGCRRCGLGRDESSRSTSGLDGVVRQLGHGDATTVDLDAADVFRRTAGAKPADSRMDTAQLTSAGS